MSNALLFLLFFAAWTLLLVCTIAAFRVVAVLRGERKANEFPAHEPHGGPFYRRLNRVHMNCVENLPVFGAVVLVTSVAQLDGPVLDLLAGLYVGARVLQSVIHLISTHPVAVNARFAAFFFQLACLTVMIIDVVVQAGNQVMVP